MDALLGALIELVKPRPVLILTGDRDTLQLVSPAVCDSRWRTSTER